MLFDFACLNKDCEVEIFEDDLSLMEVDIGHEKLCPECGAIAEKLLGGMKEKHLSWALWRTSLNQSD